MRISNMRCSFCRKTEHQVSKLVGGPSIRLLVPGFTSAMNALQSQTQSCKGISPPTPVVSRSLLEKVKERWRHLLQRSVSRETSIA